MLVLKMINEEPYFMFICLFLLFYQIIQYSNHQHQKQSSQVALRSFLFIWVALVGTLNTDFKGFDFNFNFYRLIILSLGIQNEGFIFFINRSCLIKLYIPKISSKRLHAFLDSYRSHPSESQDSCSKAWRSRNLHLYLSCVWETSRDSL